MCLKDAECGGLLQLQADAPESQVTRQGKLWRQSAVASQTCGVELSPVALVLPMMMFAFVMISLLTASATHSRLPR